MATNTSFVSAAMEEATANIQMGVPEVQEMTDRIMNMESNPL